MDEQQLDTLMKKHTAALFRIAYYYTKNLHTAEDIVQDVFIKFYEKQLEMKEIEATKYLTKMTINKAKDYLKSWHYQKLLFQEKWLKFHKANHVDPLIKCDEEAVISKAVLSLPLKLREVIVYYYLEGYSVKQVAEFLQLNENTVKSRLVKARNELKGRLENVEWEVLLNDSF